MPYADPDQNREYQRRWIQRRRDEWFEDKVCAICGVADDLQLDHIDPATKVTNAIWSWSAERREAELVKCQPLCTPCHAAKTRQQVMTVEHGSTRYRNGCRCGVCRETQRVRNAAWRASRT